MKPTRIKDQVVTSNLTPGKKVYGEKLIAQGGKEYRVWDPYRSKLCAAIYNGLAEIPLEESSTVLYLGASTGTTASHVSDLVPKGIVICIEFAPDVMKKLILLCERRENMVPVLADANQPEQYSEVLEGQKVDLLYQDVAQPNQAEILLKNARAYLKTGKHAIIAIKARSIDVAKDPKDVFSGELKKLKELFSIEQEFDLLPYDKDHRLVVCRKVR
jgi:fibrillarin-like pre-rRNA processing protein